MPLETLKLENDQLNHNQLYFKIINLSSKAKLLLVSYSGDNP